jgi:competence protein ComEA
MDTQNHPPANDLMNCGVRQQLEAGQNKIQSVAFIVAVCLCVLFSIGFAASSFLMPRESTEVKLEPRINPNTAGAASLVRLPGIGLSKAEAIIAYRKNFSESGVVFQSADDLQKVKGVGPKTVQNIKPWLKFE